MNLLIVTQKVNKNDSNLGFFHNWLLEFSKHCEKLTVVCLEKGEYDLPDNVKVLSLGKEKGVSKLTYLRRFYKYIFGEKKNYDYVFVHMNVEYVILGAWFWKMWGKKIGLWYMHKSVTGKLKMAEKLADFIFTGSKDSFRLRSDKLKILHHGIDSNLFSFQDRPIGQPLRFLTVGRVSVSKNLDLMIDLIAKLKNRMSDEPIFDIVGAPIYNKDEDYKQLLETKINDLSLNNINFVGSIANVDLPSFYQKTDIFLNFSDTGSLDKTILEAMSCGALVVSSNDSAREFLPDALFVSEKNADKIADNIVDLINQDNINLKKELSHFVKEKHSLKKLVVEILENY